MKWPTKSRYFIRSDKGYSVSKSLSKDKWRYTAWLPKGKPAEKRDFIGIFDNADDAVKACEQHHNESLNIKETA